MELNYAHIRAVTKNKSKQVMVEEEGLHCFIDSAQTSAATLCSLTELTLILAVLWLSGDGLLALAVPGEGRVGKVMS